MFIYTLSLSLSLYIYIYIYVLIWRFLLFSASEIYVDRFLTGHAPPG